MVVDLVAPNIAISNLVLTENLQDPEEDVDDQGAD